MPTKATTATATAAEASDTKVFICTNARARSSPVRQYNGRLRHVGGISNWELGRHGSGTSNIINAISGSFVLGMPEFVYVTRARCDRPPRTGVVSDDASCACACAIHAGRN